MVTFGYRSWLSFVMVAAIPALYMAQTRMGLKLQFNEATLIALIHGEAGTPFQYRALSPWILRGFIALFHLTPRDTPVLVLWWEGIILLGLAAVLRAYLREAGVGVLADVAAFSVFLVYPFLYTSTFLARFYYPSDTLSILFFATGLLALRMKRWPFFLGVFAVGTLNRETMLFLALVFAFTQWRIMPRRQLFMALAGLATLWVLIKLGLVWIYSDNPGPGIVSIDGDSPSAFSGSFASSRLAHNISALSSLSGVVTYASMCGFLWIPVLCWWRHIQDPFSRRAVLVTIPFLVVMAVVGNALEMRIYGELLPLWLGGAATAVQSLQEQRHLSAETRCV